MEIIDSLIRIRPILVNRIAQNLAKGVSVREDFREQLDQFIELLEQVVETGDANWLDPLLKNWSNSFTQTDLEEGQVTLTRTLGEILNLSNITYSEVLSEKEALDLIVTLTPYFAHAFEKAAQFEMEGRINYISASLEETRQNLERLERSKSDFISVAAHELKTPLTLVEGYSSMLRESLPGGCNNGSQLFIDGINNGTSRLRLIIEDMIDVSLLDNNLLSLSFQPVWINRLVTGIKGELEKTIIERQQTLEIISFKGCGDVFFGDPERLSQVFRNILANAIKYTPDGGRITIDGRILPGFMEITCTDTGIGIDYEDQQVIFGKFGQVGDTSLHSSGKYKFKGGGPGLGLHIAKGIIEAHGGTIWVESPGYNEKTCPGSIFHILLPMLKEPPDIKTAKLFAPLVRTND
jgi:signal transduction histidine kinase